MSILCTFPGRHGDLLWALPTVRAISEHLGTKVDLLIAGEFAGILPLLKQAPYLDHIHADPTWGMGHGWNPPGREDWISPYQEVFHLGYRRWPERVLPEEVWLTAVGNYSKLADLPAIDLHRPWLRAAPQPWRDVVYGFSDCWFELKFGITELLFDDVDRVVGIFPPGSRWCSEGGYKPTSWLEALADIAGAKVLLSDCSALHVLAVAVGTPVVLVEPMDARWNDLFYPLGKDGPEVTLVKGLDGLPTFDARHVQETLTQVLHE
jgi:hypothetical protein